jgi:hypothetical protein
LLITTLALLFIFSKYKIVNYRQLQINNVGDVGNVARKTKNIFSEMETEYQYLLEKGSRKYHCPNCNKKTFVYYIDTETGDYLPHEYGRCDRESKCSYHLSPYVDGYIKTIGELQKVTKVTNGTAQKQKYFFSRFKSQNIPQPESQSKIFYFDFETFRETLAPERYEKNMFIQNLLHNIPFPFNDDEVTKVIQLYRLGTVSRGYRAGAITFPFIDINGNIRTVQVKQFDKTNHTTGTDFLHSIIEKYCIRNNKPLPEWLVKYNLNDKKVSCLFGEYLLSIYPFNPVALVEAPKTAVYGSLYFGFPEESIENLIWLAVYNKSSFSFDKLSVLKGRIVFVFPDVSKNGNTFKEWERKAGEIEKRLPGTRFIFSDLLELSATETDKNKGYDLADYLTTQDWSLFRKQNIQEKAEFKPQPKSRIETEPPHKPEPKYEPEPTNIIIDVADVDHLAGETKLISPPSSPRTETTTKRTEKREKHQPEIWSKEIKELEMFFAGATIQDTLIQLNSYSIITDVPKFIKSHLSVVKANHGNPTFSPYLSRLQELKNMVR